MAVKNKAQYYLKGKKISLAHECKIRNLNYQVIHQRLIKGWLVEEALATPIRKHASFKFKGKLYTLKNLCQKQNWDYTFISNQIYLNKLPLDEAIKALQTRATKKVEIRLLKEKTEKKKVKRKVSSSLSPEAIATLKETLKPLQAEKKKLNREFYYSHKVFLIHEKEERKNVRDLYKKLKKENSSKIHEIHSLLKKKSAV